MTAIETFQEKKNTQSAQSTKSYEISRNSAFVHIVMPLNEYIYSNVQNFNFCNGKFFVSVKIRYTIDRKYVCIWRDLNYEQF